MGCSSLPVVLTLAFPELCRLVPGFVCGMTVILAKTSLWIGAGRPLGWVETLGIFWEKLEEDEGCVGWELVDSLTAHWRSGDRC